MALVLTGISLAGGILQSIGEFQEGEARAQAQEFNASIARNEIKIGQAARDLERKRERRKLENFLSTQQALFAKSGVKLEGSPIDVLEETATQGELDILIADINESINQSRLQSEIEQRGIAAGAARRTGRIRAGKTLLTTAVKTAGLFTPSETTTTRAGKFSGGSGGGSAVGRN